MAQTVPPQGRPDGRTARRHGTREAILETAIELFAARGVTSTSVDDIAEQAGIAKGSVYYNFDSKAGLVGAVVERSSTLLAQSLAAAADDRSGAALREAVVRALLRLIRDNTASARIMVSELFRTERDWRESIEGWREVALKPLVDDLVAAGVAADRAHLQAAATVGAILVAGLEWLVFDPALDIDDVAEAVLASLV